ADFSVPAAGAADGSGVFVGPRPVAQGGVAVRDWGTYYGAAPNVYPHLEPFRPVRTRARAEPMTSLERERRGPPPPALVRGRLLEHFAARFGFGRTSLFFHHPALGPRAGSGTVTSRS